MPGIHQGACDPSLRVQFHVGLGNDKAVFLPGGQAEGIGLEFDQSLVVGLEAAVRIFNRRPFQLLPQLEVGVPAVGHHHGIHHLPVLHLSIGAFDESEFVDLGIAAQG